MIMSEKKTRRMKNHERVVGECPCKRVSTKNNNSQSKISRNSNRISPNSRTNNHNHSKPPLSYLPLNSPHQPHPSPCPSPSNSNSQNISTHKPTNTKPNTTPITKLPFVTFTKTSTLKNSSQRAILNKNKSLRKIK